MKVDRLTLFHPEVLARSDAHKRRQRGTCAVDLAKNKEERRWAECTCRPDPDDIAARWAGRARMARGRQAAGVPLDALDVKALDRERST